MDYIIQEIELLLQILILRRKKCNKGLAASPDGGLIRPKVRNRPVYMHSITDGTYSNGQPRYARKELSEDSDLFQKLVLKEYLRIVLKRLDHNIRVLERAKAGLIPIGYDAIRSLMRRPYRDISDEVFQRAFHSMFAAAPSDLFPCSSVPGFLAMQHEWASQPFEQSTYRPEEKIHTTSRGLKVRSRAELLIAELLYRYDIPFRYEQVIRCGKYELAPDFTFLDSNGNEFYWEYCGMMGDPSYRDHQLWRRSMYEGIGITEWNDMICTYDAKDSIDMREIEAIIQTKVLPRMQAAA